MKHIYLFHQGNAAMKDLLGGKGANLAEMTRAGLPVPPGFTITTAACLEYLENLERRNSESSDCLPVHLMSEVFEALESVEKAMNRKFGDPEKPLLLSVRSGAKVSMPGMMETVLNLGLNDRTIQGLIQQSGNERFAYDSYRRFIQMFSTVVLDLSKTDFDNIFYEIKRRFAVNEDTELDTKALQEVVAAYKALVQNTLGQPFPQEPMMQLKLGIEAVFRSWNIPRAISYRNFHKIDHTLGTAVNVQAMVFGNLGNHSATGVAFTRNPSTGEKELYGEYLVNAQGEDVVAGIRTPQKISEMAQLMPDLYQEFMTIAQQLEAHYKDVQDIEFTIENGRLFMLQTRTAKRTIQAAVKIAVDMADEGVITQEEALLRIDANALPQLLLPGFEPTDKGKARAESRLLATGLNASPGSATGMIVFDPDEAETRAQLGEAVILVREETCPDDVHGMIAAKGVLTSRGGNTSHAAVVARGMGKPCVVGCSACRVDEKNETLTSNQRILKKGDVISIDGTTGEVFEGRIQTVEPTMNAEFETLLTWADQTRRLGVRANADTPEDAQKAVELGARGIGLCRTEHMFMAPDRLPVVQEMILSGSFEERQAALAKLLPMQLEDFKGIFRAMADYPVTIRLLDPPLHEFLPDEMALVLEVQAHPDEKKQAMLDKVSELSERNPMMGFRGCRLGLVYPEIYRMQVKAIFEAATDLAKEGINVQPEIMIPLVGHFNELKILRECLETDAEDIMNQKGKWLPYLFGTMIEVPRAAFTADKIAQFADFFSFGTNDLTQLTFGFSRDDAEGKFLARYLERGILTENPFETLDTEGVGQMLKMACDKGRRQRPNIKLGICGEHGGEDRSVKFCHHIGLDYVSCSPFRVPVARLAAAQAMVQERIERAKMQRAQKTLMTLEK